MSLAVASVRLICRDDSEGSAFTNRDDDTALRPTNVECMGVLGRDLTDLCRESSAQHVSLLERNPLACPPVSGTTIGRVILSGAPSLAATVVQRFELEEVPLVHLRLGRPDVVPFDAQRVNDASKDTSLLQNFTDDGGLRRLRRLDGPGGHLDTGDLERNVVVREHQNPPIADDVSDDLSNEPTLRPCAHATLSGVIDAICSPARSSARSSS